MPLEDWQKLPQDVLNADKMGIGTGTEIATETGSNGNEVGAGVLATAEL